MKHGRTSLPWIMSFLMSRNDGKVSDSELKDYLGETMTYYARRYYGRDQNVQIMQGN